MTYDGRQSAHGYHAELLAQRRARMTGIDRRTESSAVLAPRTKWKWSTTIRAPGQLIVDRLAVGPRGDRSRRPRSPACAARAARAQAALDPRPRAPGERLDDAPAVEV
jgi:hypothetical protein